MEQLASLSTQEPTVKTHLYMGIISLNYLIMYNTP